MARTRLIKPDFFLDSDLGELSLQARYCFSGLWCYADKCGRLNYEPKKLKALIFPYDNVNMVNILESLNGEIKPFIIIYEIDSKKYIQIVNWEKHQSPHHTEKDSIIPPFNGVITVKEQLQKGAMQDAPFNIKYQDKVKHLDTVYLTIDEYKKLIDKFGENGTKDRIERLNEGIMSKGYKYKSHYHTILSWERRQLSTGYPQKPKIEQRGFMKEYKPDWLKEDE